MDDELLWRPRRKAAEPTFRTSVLRSYLSIFNENAKVCIDLLKNRCHSGETLNIAPFWDRLNLDNILTTSMGITEDIQNNENSEYLVNLDA
jgi:cytochrome P450